MWPWFLQQTRSFTADVRAKPEYHKFLIGKGGGKIRKVRDTTGARIIFPTAEDKDQDLITIMGKEDAVREAQKELEALIQNLVRPSSPEPQAQRGRATAACASWHGQRALDRPSLPPTPQDNVVEDCMLVDPKHHRHFVIRRGQVLREIAEEYGGVMVSFPRSGTQSDKVTLKGAKDCVEAAKKRIQEIIEDLVGARELGVLLGHSGGRAPHLSHRAPLARLPFSQSSSLPLPGHEELPSQAAYCSVHECAARPGEPASRSPLLLQGEGNRLKERGSQRVQGGHSNRAASPSSLGELRSCPAPHGPLLRPRRRFL